MRLVNFDEFCRMPAGTVFAPYTPCVLEEGLAIKVDAGEDLPITHPCYRYSSHTFLGVMPLQPFNLEEVYNDGPTTASFETYDGSDVDYMGYETFLVFEESDIERFIKVLRWAKAGCKEEFIEFERGINNV